MHDLKQPVKPDFYVVSDKAVIGFCQRPDSSSQNPLVIYVMLLSMQSFSRLIGEGSIGRVHLGRWQETDVAIKSLSSLKHIAITTDITSGSTRSSSEDSRAPNVDATMRTLEREVTIPLHFQQGISHLRKCTTRRV